MKNCDLIKILRAKEEELKEEVRQSKCAVEVCKAEERKAHDYLLLAEKTFIKYPSAKTEEIYWKRFEAWTDSEAFTYSAEEVFNSFCDSLEAVKEARRTLEQLETLGL